MTWLDKALTEAQEQARIDNEIAAKIHIASEAWCAKWPFHCKACGGWGGANSRQGHPYGSTTAYEDVFDLCEAPRSGCHRCDGPLVDDDQGPCTKCGWNCDDGDPQAQG